MNWLFPSLLHFLIWSLRATPGRPYDILARASRVAPTFCELAFPLIVAFSDLVLTGDTRSPLQGGEWSCRGCPVQPICNPEYIYFGIMGIGIIPCIKTF